MKRNLFSLCFITLAIISLSMNQLKAQAPSFFDGFSLKAGGGLTTFYGELGAPGLSVLKYTKAGFAGSAIKMFTPALGIQVNYLTGNLYSFRADLAQYFIGSVQEISLSARVEPLLFFNRSYSGKLHPYFRGGIGTTGFRAVRRDQNTNTVFLPTYGYATDGITKVARENALSIPLSVGLGYQLSNRIAIELEQSISLTNTDIMDAVVGTAASNDMFGFTQIGLKFTFGSIPSGEPKETISPAVKSGTGKVRRSKKPTKDRSKRDDDYYVTDPASEDSQLKQIPVPITNIFVESTIPDKPVSGKTFEVNIRINKSDYEGPAILTQVYPDGFTALESQISYSRFSFINQKVRIIWDNMPEDSIITYTYHVRPGEMVHGSHTINGGFEYRLPDGPKLIQFANYIYVDNRIESDMDARILKLLGEDVGEADQESEKNIAQLEKERDLELQIEDLLRKYGNQPSKQVVENDPDIKITKHQAIQGVEFRIQCGAFRVQTEGQRIVRRYNITEPVSEDYHNGLYKYTVGSFATYNEAASYRDKFIQRSKIWTAFIVAYENGKRLNSLNQAYK
ncbi:MAG: hypothetical protein U9N86_10575 [Bacteroidota bacterium]|nr:hypothetical protein [Bacteroidota bacterium]